MARAQASGIEAYDDAELLQELLKERVQLGDAADEAMTTGGDEGVAMSQQWLKLRRLRRREQRKNVDRRASKGRKLRYQPHEKLQVFMAPATAQRYPQRDLVRTTELFKSLFGAVVRAEEDDDEGEGHADA